MAKTKKNTSAYSKSYIAVLQKSRYENVDYYCLYTDTYPISVFFFLTGFDTDKIRSLGRRLLLSNCRKIDYNILYSVQNSRRRVDIFYLATVFSRHPGGTQGRGHAVYLSYASRRPWCVTRLSYGRIRLTSIAVPTSTVYTRSSTKSIIPSRGRSSRGTRPTWA